MHKIRFFIILFLLPFSLLAQQKTKIILQRSKTATVDAKTNISYLKYPVFKQDNAILTCDSAVFYQDKNVFDAYDHVHINQADTINIFSDRLTYDGNTKNAHLTSNVKMIDKESVLTTNILDYNLGTKIGTYVESGKIVSKQVTVTSTNGYYFSNSRDAYFRYNVVVVTPESVIKSDTLRYNTGTNWAYFYGPTNIKGKDDNLYTENGAYNTKTQYAYFGKKNLYTQDSKSLKGDSLYYDGIAGYGKAVRNIVFRDTTDKTVMYGQLGFYYKKDQRTIVTKNPYIGLATSDSVMVGKKLRPDSLWMGADTLETQMVLLKSLKLIEHPVLKKDNEMGEEEKPEKKVGSTKGKTEATEQKPGKRTPGKVDDPKKPAAVPPVTTPPVTTAKDSLSKDNSPKGNLSKANLSKDSLAKVNSPKQGAPPGKQDSTALKKTPPPVVKKVAKVTPKLTNPDTVILKTLSPAELIIPAAMRDSLKKAKTADSLLQIKAAAAVKKTATGKNADKKNAANLKMDKKSLVKDTIPFNPADTIKARAIRAYHHVRVFKNNMQARADSLFYTSSDSTLRWYGSPILWAEGSQQTGDTIYLRLKNKQLNTSQVIHTAFLVNVNADSAHFNQIKGKVITGFFKDGKLDRMFVDGNAESIYFNRENSGEYTEMNQTVSSRIKMLFKNKEIDDIVNVKDTEGVRTPMKDLKEDVYLTGFTWKPELRPLSKKEAINGKPKGKQAVFKSPKGLKAKPGDKADGDEKGKPIDEKGKPQGSTPSPAKDKTSAAPAKTDLKVKPETKTDSLKTTAPVVKPVPLKTDSIKPVVKATADSTLKLQAPLKVDTTKVVPSKKQ